MATFDLNEFVSQPSIAVLETCRKDDLFLIARHFEIPVSKTLLKKDLKACLLTGLINDGVLSLLEDVPESVESVAAVMDEEQPPLHSSTSLRSLAGNPVTPGAGGGAKVGPPPLSLPKFEPLSLSTEESPVHQGGLRLKVRLARLQLETQDRAQARKDELQHQLELYRIDAEMKVKMRELDLCRVQTARFSK